jgi:predicted alpha/beta-fold hydrolase
MNISETLVLSTISSIGGCFWLWNEPVPGYEPFIFTMLAIVSLVALTLRSQIPSSDSAFTRCNLRERQMLVTRDVFAYTKVDDNEVNVIGENIQYLDNGVKSDILLIFLHGLGLDANDFRHYMEVSKYRCLAPTLYGFNRNENILISLSIDAHTAILTSFINSNIEKITPKTVILVGFSIGADMVQYIVKANQKLAKKIDGMLLLDGNINHSTCTISNRFALINPKNHNNVVEIVRSISEGTENLSEWLQVHQYLVKVFSKFKNRTPILARFAKETSERFDSNATNGLDYFISNFQATTDKVRNVQYIFSGESNNKKALNDFKALILSDINIASAYSDDSIKIENNMKHFDLIEYVNLNSFIDQTISKSQVLPS